MKLLVYFMSVCRSLRTQFRRTWQSPSNAHAYRLYVVSEPSLLNVASLLRLACPAAISEAHDHNSFLGRSVNRLARFCLPQPLVEAACIALSEALDYRRFRRIQSTPEGRCRARLKVKSCYLQPLPRRTQRSLAFYAGFREPVNSAAFFAPASTLAAFALLFGRGRTLASRFTPAAFDANSYARFRTATGKDRARLPVRTNSAFATAGAIGGTPGSPTPLGARVLGTIHVSTFG